MSNSMRLRFHVPKSFGQMSVRAGAVIDVPTFWARIFLSEGSASIADSEAEVENETEKVPEPAIERGGRKRSGKRN